MRLTENAACLAPMAAQMPSASILSSSASNDAGLPPVTGRPSIGSSVVTNGVANQIPRRSGSKASMAARAASGRWCASRSWARISAVIEVVAGGVTVTTSQ